MNQDCSEKQVREEKRGKKKEKTRHTEYAGENPELQP